MDSVRDRAVEWVNENTDLDGAEWEAKVSSVAAELEALDAEADAADLV